MGAHTVTRSCSRRFVLRRLRWTPDQYHKRKQTTWSDNESGPTTTTSRLNHLRNLNYYFEDLQVMSSALRGRVNQKRHGLFPCYGRSHINLLIINILNDLDICLCLLQKNWHEYSETILYFFGLDACNELAGLGFNVPWKFPSVQCQGISGMTLETSRHYTTERKRWKCFFCFGQIWGSFTKSRHQTS